MSENPSADHVTVEVAGTLAGIPARTLRHWIAAGKLAAIAGERGKLVSLREVAHLARIVGKPVGNMASAADNPATSAEEVAGNLAESLAESLAGAALVTDTARQQLATIRDEWFFPLIAQLGALERENGRLAAATTTQAETIAELRRRAEQAEAARDRLTAAQAAPDAPGAPEEVSATNPRPEASAGFWARVRRVFGGG